MQDLSGLIIAARNGDSPAFEELVRRFQDMAVGYAYSILGDWHEAEDAAQDAFVSAYCSLIQLRDAAAFPGWFRRIVYTPLHFVICFGPKEFLDPLPDLTAAAQDVGVYRLLTDAPRFLLGQGADLMAREADESRSPLELADAAFEDETDRGDVIALLEAAEAQRGASDGSSSG